MLKLGHEVGKDKGIYQSKIERRSASVVNFLSVLTMVKFFFFLSPGKTEDIHLTTPLSSWVSMILKNSVMAVGLVAKSPSQSFCSRNLSSPLIISESQY